MTVATAVRAEHALSAEHLEEVHADEARLEQLVGLEEFATDAAASYAILVELYESERRRGITDLRWRRALYILARAGTRARRAADEIRALTPDGAA